MAKNKILYITGASFDPPSAQLIHVLKMSSSLLEFYDVDLFIFDKTYKVNLDSFNLQNKPNIISRRRKRYSVSLQMAFILIKLLITQSYRVVVTRNVFICFICHLLNKKFIYETHDAIRGTLKNIFERSVLKSNSLVKFIVISESLAKDYKNLFDCSPSVCHDAADIFDKNIILRKEVKKIFYIGSVYKGRGIEIIQDLSTLHQDIEFHIFGGKEVYKDKNMFFRGYISQKEIQLEILEADIVLMPYQVNLETVGGGINTVRWMSPMKMFEYMSFGIPIISSDLPVIREVLNSHNSILVKPSDLIEWNNAINKLKQDVQLRTRISTEAKMDQQKKYTWDKRPKLFHQFIQNA